MVSGASASRSWPWRLFFAALGSCPFDVVVQHQFGTRRVRSLVARRAWLRTCVDGGKCSKLLLILPYQDPQAFKAMSHLIGFWRCRWLTDRSNMAQCQANSGDWNALNTVHPALDPRASVETRASIMTISLLHIETCASRVWTSKFDATW